MSISLHTAVVQTYQQILPAVAGLLDKAEEHCQAQGLAVETLTEARLAEDMWPFAKQVFECAHHSSRAIEGVRAGEFGPKTQPVPSDLASMRKELAEAMTIVDAVDPGELDTIAGRDMFFKFGDHQMPFIVSDFLLSFSLPNFYFHATTAYDILRSRDVKIGKMDYLGKLRMKR
jgi:hypothetical protein